MPPCSTERTTRAKRGASFHIIFDWFLLFHQVPSPPIHFELAKSKAPSTQRTRTLNFFPLIYTFTMEEMLAMQHTYTVYRAVMVQTHWTHFDCSYQEIEKYFTHFFCLKTQIVYVCIIPRMICLLQKRLKSIHKTPQNISNIAFASVVHVAWF